MRMAMLSKSLTQFDSYMFYMIQLIPGFIMVVLVSQANCDGLLPSALCTSIVQAENVRLESEHMLLKTCTLGKCLGIKPAAPAVEPWSLNHWTIREIP